MKIYITSNTFAREYTETAELAFNVEPFTFKRSVYKYLWIIDQKNAEYWDAATKLEWIVDRFVEL